MSKQDLAIAKEQTEGSKKLAEIRTARRGNESLTKTAERLGITDMEQLGEYLSEQYQIPFIDLGQFEIDADSAKALPPELCKKHCVMPISKTGTTLVIAFVDPSNLFLRDELAYVSKCKVEAVVSTEKSIREAQRRYFREDRAKAGDILSEMEEESQEIEDSFAEDTDGDAPVIKFVNVMISEAVNSGSSDIHIESYEKSVRVRFRKDGQLIEKYRPPKNIGNALATRIKVMAQLDVAERRRPQDGRIKLKFKEKGEVDFRVNILPVVDGEKVVLRILDQSSINNVKLTDLGFDEEQLVTLLSNISKKQGMMLVTGPTGSGKTTTLYASLQKIHNPKINISTAEDPVEFKLEGVNQTQVNSDIDYGFAEALRAFLRQDPDVILLGEIRDHETAEIAFKAASTGHLVLSTLHTNDAPSSISRLQEMGVPGYILTTCVELIVAQRLLGKICGDCRVEERISEKALDEFGLDADYKNMIFYKGEGCNACLGTGISGRVAVYEFMELNHSLKELVIKGATPMELKKAAIKGGMMTLRMSGMEKAKKGLVSLADVVQGTMKDPIV